MHILRRLTWSVLSTAALAVSPVAAKADESFILAHAMKTDHVFHSISQSFIDQLGEDEGFDSSLLNVTEN